MFELSSDVDASDAFDNGASFRNALIKLVFPDRASPITKMRKSSCIVVTSSVTRRQQVQLAVAPHAHQCSRLSEGNRKNVKILRWCK